MSNIASDSFKTLPFVCLFLAGLLCRDTFVPVVHEVIALFSVNFITSKLFLQRMLSKHQLKIELNLIYYRVGMI